jgi:hypothetical protein
MSITVDVVDKWMSGVISKIPVTDDEILYRRVPYGRNLYILQPDGTVRFSSQAFSDRSFRPSVDRAKLCYHDPRRTQHEASDGVTSLVVHDVRSIDTIVQNDKDGKPIRTFGVDVEHVPILNHPELPDNPAHAEIHTVPECPDKKIFRKLCERLAQLASKRSWEIEPQA